MAITREDFKNVPSSGKIPEDRLPATEFAVAYAFTYTGSPSTNTSNHSFTGKIVLYFYDVNGNVKYVISIEETYNLFIFPLAPGLVLYTWNWVPSAEKINGRTGEDETAAPMETLGEATFGVDPAEGSGTSDNEVIVDSRFYSGIFLEGLDSGDSVKIHFHNLSAGFVVARASLQLATLLGAPASDTLRDERTGQIWTLYNLNGTVQCASTRRLEKYQLKTPSQVLDKAATFLRGLRVGGTLYVVFGQTGLIRLAASYDEGDSWSEVMPIVTGVLILAAVESERADTLYVYGQATADDLDAGVQKSDVVRVILTRANVKEWKQQEKSLISNSGLPKGESLPAKNIISLERNGATFRLYAKDDDFIRILTSSDELASFKELAALDETT